jgi:hypothetical protein
MKVFSLIKNFTVVIGMLFSVSGIAQTAAPFVMNDEFKEKRAFCIEDLKKTGDALEECLRNLSGGGGQSTQDRDRADCSAARTAQTAAQKELERACATSGIGAGRSCLEKSRTCEEEQPEEDLDLTSLSSLNPMIGSFLGTFGTMGACPTLTAADYRSQSKEIKNNIEESKKDIEEAKQDLVSRESEVQNDFSDINTDIANLDKERKEAESAFSNESLEQERGLSAALKEANASLAQSQIDLINIGAAERASLASKAVDLSALSDEFIKLQCEGVAKEEKAKRGQTKSSAGLGGLTKGTKKTTNDLSLIFYACAKKEFAKRAAIIEKYRSEMEALAAQRSLKLKQQEEIRKAINEMKAQSLTMKANATTAQQNAFNDYVTGRQNLIQKMTMLDSNWQKEQASIKEKTQRLEQDINQSSNDMLQLGPPPKGSTTSTYREVLRERGNYEAARSNVYSQCCQSAGRKAVTGAGINCSEYESVKDQKDPFASDGAD